MRLTAPCGNEFGFTARPSARTLIGSRLRSATMALPAAFALLLLQPPSSAQDTQHPVQHEEVSQHHLVQYEVMKQMSDEMARMADEMSRNNVTPDQRKQMARRMDRMSIIMHRMSGLESRPAMTEPQMKAEMEKMKREMDAMMRDQPAQPTAK